MMNVTYKKHSYHRKSDPATVKRRKYVCHCEHGLSYGRESDSESSSIL
jgi:hypothetical protein